MRRLIGFLVLLGMAIVGCEKGGDGKNGLAVIENG